MENVKVKIGNDVKMYTADTPILEIAKEYSKDYKYNIIAALRNNKVCDLVKKIDRDCTLEFITLDSPTGNKIYVRGISMLLLKAVYNVFEKGDIEKVNIESCIGNGFYCEITGNAKLDENSLARVKETMQSYVERDIPFIKESVQTDYAAKLFASFGMRDKERLFRYRMASRVNIYNLDGFIDYFYGAMPPSTGMLKYFDLQLYGDGFVFVVPDATNPEKLEAFKGSPKFYNIVKESNEWGVKMHIDSVGALNDAVASGRMQDLILVQEALHEKRIGDIASDIAKRENVKIVLIAGPSSSGKTTFSHRLSIQLSTLGLSPHPIAVDDYFVNREKTPRDEEGNFNYECLEALDIEQFNSDMTRLLAGERVELPSYNFILGKREYNGKFRQLGKDDILVIEGIHGLNDKLTHSLPQDSKYKIYISALTQINIDEHNRIPTTDGRLIRRIVRDARTRGADAQKTISMWQSVRKGENSYIFPYQECADAMFNSALIYELSVLKQYAEPLLFNVDRDSSEYIEAKRLLKFLDYFLGLTSENINNNSILREFIGGSIFPV